MIGRLLGSVNGRNASAPARGSPHPEGDPYPRTQTLSTGVRPLAVGAIDRRTLAAEAIDGRC